MILRWDNCILLLFGLGWTGISLLGHHPQPPVWLLAIPVALAGLPHGAIDAVLARHRGIWSGALQGSIFHAAYIALAGVILLTWQYSPTLSLALFLTVSAWHFGGDWRDECNTASRLLAGFAIIGLPVIFQPQQVAAIFTLLAGDNNTSIILSLGWLAIAGCAALATIAVRQRAKAANVIIEAATLLACAATLPPLVYFVLYFCGLHSMRHLARSASEVGWSKIKTAVPYTLATLIIGAAILAANLHSYVLQDALIRTIFIGLAALTVPHMVLIDVLKRRQDADQPSKPQTSKRYAWP